MFPGHDINMCAIKTCFCDKDKYSAQDGMTETDLGFFMYSSEIIEHRCHDVFIRLTGRVTKGSRFFLAKASLAQSLSFSLGMTAKQWKRYAPILHYCVLKIDHVFGMITVFLSSNNEFIIVIEQNFNIGHLFSQRMIDILDKFLFWRHICLNRWK